MADTILQFDDVLRSLGDDKYNLLLGNGFSCSVYSGFRYDSLFEVARSHGLPDVPVAMFERYGTTNFEAVMRLLEDANWIAKKYGIVVDGTSTPMINDLDLVRQALIRSISSTHPPHTFSLTEQQKQSCFTFLNRFHDVFSLNYDLLLYWVLMGSGRWRVDGFGFPSSDTEDPPYLVLAQPRDQKPWLFHMHGALHLYTVDGEVRKHRYQHTRRPLVEVICEGIENSEYPLFVAEGTSRQKMKHIRSNMYLSLCFQEFVRSTNDLVCFGMSFDESDNHIADAIANNGKVNRIFVGIHGDFESQSNLKTRAAIRRIQDKRSEHLKGRGSLEVIFFASDSAEVWGS
jgi:hypothetical protein